MSPKLKAGLLMAPLTIMFVSLIWFLLFQLVKHTNPFMLAVVLGIPVSIWMFIVGSNVNLSKPARTKTTDDSFDDVTVEEIKKEEEII